MPQRRIVGAPTAPQQEVLEDYRGRLDRALDEWTARRNGDLAALNKSIEQQTLKKIRVPTPAEIDIGEPSEGKDLP